jgi:1,4-alpha-glucan branching enzyme
MARKESNKTENKEETLKKIKFSLDAPEAQSVFVTGDFNDWDPKSQPLKKHSKKTWKVSVHLMSGRYEYRFLVDGIWQNDPKCNALIPNSYGSDNCILIVQ